MSCQLQALKRKVQGTCLQITVVLTEAMKRRCHTSTSKHFGSLLTRKESNKIRISVCISVLTNESRQFPVRNWNVIVFVQTRLSLNECPALCYRETLMTEPALHGAIPGECLESRCCGNRGGDQEKNRSQNPQVSTNVTVNAKFTNMKAWIFSQ